MPSTRGWSTSCWVTGYPGKSRQTQRTSRVPGPALDEKCPIATARTVSPPQPDRAPRFRRADAAVRRRGSTRLCCHPVESRKERCTDRTVRCADRRHRKIMRCHPCDPQHPGVQARSGVGVGELVLVSPQAVTAGEHERWRHANATTLSYVIHV